MRANLARIALPAALLSGALGPAGCGGAREAAAPETPGPSAAEPADVIYENGTIVTMKSDLDTAKCVATKGSTIVCVDSSESCCSAYRGPATQIVDLKGATLLPGFIDSHSHMSSWGLFNDPEQWIDVSSVNVLLKPPPGDPRCTTPDDYQKCFIPVKSQDDVVARLKTAAAKAAADPTNPQKPILAFNYDPSRLGHSNSCQKGGVAFECTNFEDGTARAQLDAISKTNPILVTSESGHISYVNSEELRLLNICSPGQPPGCCPPNICSPGQPPCCRAPIENADVEMKLAQLGQLDEDLALYSMNKAMHQAYPTNVVEALVRAIKTAASVYAQNGFTTIQEGAASGGEAAAYAIATLDEGFPVTAALLLYDASQMDVTNSIKAAQGVRALEKTNPNVRAAGIKAFADGSNQGYTGLLTAPYKDLYAPFTSKTIFPAQPYVGLPDAGLDQLAANFKAAHAAGFPLMVHQNGDGAIDNALAALEIAGPAPGLRDLMIHFSISSPDDLQKVKAKGTGVTFMIPNLYYYGTPMCHQVLGRERTERLYPTADAVKAGLRFGLHADTTVTPPVPLFMIWVAKTRKAQQMPWYGAPPECPEVLGKEQSISIQQGLKAFTIDAAYLYGLEGQVGSIEVGKTADFVQLSEDPRKMEDTPDDLKRIRVIGTVHRGRFIANPNAEAPPIWPG